jgi:predicted cobalt transporter CbtA
MLAGLVAGLAAFVFAYGFGEPAVESGIAYEELAGAAAPAEQAHAHGAADAGHSHGVAAGEELVGRGVQSTVGLLVGLTVYAVAIGGILALVHAATRGRVGPARPRDAALALAAAGFVSVVLVPFLKYPGNPPGSSDGGSIGQRTGLYLVMLLLSVLLAVVATAVARALAPRLGTWTATVVAVVGYAVVALVAGSLLPAVDETPADFPAAALYDFRLASLGVQLVLWAALGLAFAALVDRGVRREVAAAR